MILGFIGTTELILIGGLALLLVGVKKLPEMMRGLGKGVREFKDGMKESSATIQEESVTDDAIASDSDTEHSTKEKSRTKEM